MGAATNIPITATTTDFVGAIEAARKAINNFDKDLNGKLVTGFRAADREQKNYDQGLGRVQRHLAQLAADSARHTSKIADGFKSAGTNLTTYLTAPLALASGAAYKAYADIDGMIKGLKVVTGSAQGATNQFKEFYAASQKPGLGLDETVAAGLQLEVLGFQAQTAKKYVEEVGNAIALGGKGKVEFGQVITQFTQMAGKAKVLSEDLKPIVTASPVIAKAINDMFGTVDSEQISAKLQAVGKGPRDFIASLVTELSKIERVEAGPKTALENFGDATKIAGYELGKAADEAYGLTEKLNGLGSFLSDGATAFGQTSSAAKLTTFTVVGLAASIGPLALGLGSLIKAYQAATLATSAFRVGLAALTGPIAIAAAATIAVGALGYALYKTTQPIVELTTKAQLLSSVNATVTQSIAGERSELERLYRVATDETKSKEERRKAIAALNQLSPEYLGFLNKENISSSQAADAVRKMGDAILFRARARAAEDKITELSRKRFEVEQKPVSDFERPFNRKLNPLSGMPEIISPNQIKEQAQQYKNEALLAIDANIAEITNYAEKNSRRAGRRGISLEIPTTPTFDFKGVDDSAYDKLKADVKAARDKIRDFVTKNGAKAKIPLQLQADFDTKSALLKAADNTTKTIKPRVSVEANPQSTDLLAIAKRYEDTLSTKVQNAGPKVDPKDIERLQAVKTLIENIEASTSSATVNRTSISGIAELANPGTNQALAGILANLTRIKAATPALFANTNIASFLTTTQRAEPMLDAYRAKIDEIKQTIAELTRTGADYKSPAIQKLVAQLKELKQALAEAMGASDRADASTDPGAGGEENKKWLDRANQRIADMKAHGKEVKKTAQEMAGDMKDAHDSLAGQGVQVLTAIGDGLAQGTNPLKSVLNTILGFLGDFMLKLGTAMLIGGTLLSAAEVAFPFLAPLLQLKGPAAILAGSGLVAGGALVKGLALKGFAKGGVFDQPSVGLFGEYAGATFNREIATPENLMRDVFRGSLNSFAQDGGFSPFNQVRDSYASKPNTFNHKIEIAGVVRGSDLHVMLRRHQVSLDAFGC